MEIDALSKDLFENDVFRSQNQSFKDDFDEQLFYLLANNLPNATISTNNSFILQRMNSLFADVQPTLFKYHLDLTSTHVFGSQANGLALKDSDIDLTILTKSEVRSGMVPRLYDALQKIPESRFLKLGFCQKFTFNMLYHPTMKGELIQISNIQTKKCPTHFQSLDIVLNGYDGIKNSLAIGQIVQTSKAYRYLVLLLKLWLRQFPRKRRMPLYSYYIMAAHYLQHIVHPALLPTIDLRRFKERSLQEKLLAHSHTRLFPQIDLTDHQGFSGLSSLLKGFFNYYGIQYHMNDKKPAIFVSQHSKWESPYTPLEKTKQSKPPTKKSPKPIFDILDPLSGQFIVDLKSFEKTRSVHVQDLEDAYHRLNSNENIFSQKVKAEKNITSLKQTKHNPASPPKLSLFTDIAKNSHQTGDFEEEDDELFRVIPKKQNPSKNTAKANLQTDDFEGEDDELFRVIPKKQNNPKIDLNISPEKSLFAKAAAADFARDNEDDELRVTKRKRITRRINDTLERKLLFQKSNQQQELAENDTSPKPQQPFFKKRNQPKQFKFAESDPTSNQKSFSEVQQHLLQKRTKKSKFAEIRVKTFTKILRVVPK